MKYNREKFFIRVDIPKEDQHPYPIKFISNSKMEAKLAALIILFVCSEIDDDFNYEGCIKEFDFLDYRFVNTIKSRFIIENFEKDVENRQWKR